MIGHVYPGVASDQPVPGLPDCVDEGGAALTANGTDLEGWWEGLFFCRGRRYLLLQRLTGYTEDGNPQWRIVDAKPLPRFVVNRADGKNSRTRYLHSNGDCTLDHQIGTSIKVVLRWGKRQHVTSRTGIEAAWGFDTELGRIIPIDVSRVECWDQYADD
jgi:hypothetical protein